MLKSSSSIAALALMMLVLSASVGGGYARAADAPTDPNGSRAPRVGTPGSELRLNVPLFQSQVVTLPDTATRVSVANPAVADLVVISPTQFYVLAKDIGMTNVLIWDRNNVVSSSVIVEVTHDLAGLKSRLAALLPGNRIEVASSQRSIVLSGMVADAASADAATRIARSYLAKEEKIVDKGDGTSTTQKDDEARQIINLLQIGGAQQVMLQVKVAEISRTELKRLNAKFSSLGNDGNWSIGGVNGGGRFIDERFGTEGLNRSVFPGRGNGAGSDGGVSGPVVDRFDPNDLSVQNAGIFASFLSNDFLFNLAVDAAKDKGLAKILAEPNLTTLTGQEAKFLSGGEFPIPVPQQGTGSITIEFKEFGVSLRMLPTVLSSGQINVKLDVSVSELQSGNAVNISPGSSNATFVIPTLSKRSASGTVELADGQTIGLAGMIDNNMRSVVSRFPGLGNLPILGALFRSQDWQQGESELVILVTPRLAKPVDPAKISLPTDGVTAPGDWEFFGLGRQQGAAK
jgi:pilus assembly protein CpaC